MVEGFVYLDRARVYDISPEQTHSRLQEFQEPALIIIGIPNVASGSACLLSLRNHSTWAGKQAVNPGNILAFEKVSVYPVRPYDEML